MSRSLRVQSVALAIVVGMSGAAAFGDEEPLSADPTIQTIADQAQSDEQVRPRPVDPPET